MSPEQIAERRLLTYEDVAALLHVSTKTVRRWRDTGKLKAVAFGRKTVRFRQEEVRRFVEKAAKG